MSDLPEYLAARALEGALSSLPERAGLALGAAAGGLARALGVRREVALRQVAAAFPGRGEAWVRGVVEACYRHYGREAAALARLSRVDPERLAGATAGTEQLAGALAAGERPPAGRPGGGRIVVTGHLGNWELAGAVVAGLGYPVVAVVKPQANRRFDRRVEALRRRLGIETVPMAAAGRRLPAALAEGAVVALVADQDAGSRGVFVPFLGRPASTFRGPARLALREGVPLLFGKLVRDTAGGPDAGPDPGAPAGYRMAAEEVERPEPGPGAEEELTRRWTSRLEEAVRERPGQYFWFHRRWKTRP